jgi:hypothetical protein
MSLDPQTSRRESAVVQVTQQIGGIPLYKPSKCRFEDALLVMLV